MKFYQEITLLNQANTHKVWSKLYNFLHIGLVDIKNKQGIMTIGVSFPQYCYEELGDKTYAVLGDKLRVFATYEADLEKLDLATRLQSLLGELYITAILPVPTATSHLVVKKYRYKSLQRKAMSYAVFKRISYQEALSHVKQYNQPPKHYPYVVLKSATNQVYYPLAILQEPATAPQMGGFNHYGINNISGTSTVPHW